ncbi:MAG TPA: hypothetical protein VGY98_01455, partial [Verrucomicrobiae bacterium]|nr:hypothetical protein [Verrucomicrobiae bacterium]
AASPLGYWFSWALGARIADSFLKNEPLPFARIPLVPSLLVTIASYFVRPALPFLFVLSAFVTAIAVSRLLGNNRSEPALTVSDSTAPGSPEIRRNAFFWNIFQTIGLWSYSIYLLHQPLLNAISLLMSNVIPGTYRPGVATFLYFIVAWVIIILVSGLWRHVFELPGIAVGKWIIRNMETRAPKGALRFNKGFYVMVVPLAVIVAGILVLTTKLNERDSRSELDLAEFLTAKHRYAAALGHYRSALDHDANCVDALNNAAWLLATAPNPRLRDGKTAVELASKACELTGDKQAFFIGTLAAAEAEAGQFDAAIANAQKARTLALRHGQIGIATTDEQLLELYQAGKPFHETADTK